MQIGINLQLIFFSPMKQAEKSKYPVNLFFWKVLIQKYGTSVNNDVIYKRQAGFPGFARVGGSLRHLQHFLHMILIWV